MGENYLRSLTGRLLSSAAFTAPERPKNVRLDSHGDVFTVPGLTGPQGAALSGAYFVGANPTVGTGIATTTSITAFTAASPVAMLYNAGTRVIVPDYFTMLFTAAPTSATAWHYAWILDPVDRLSSAGTAIVPAPTNSAVSAASDCRFTFGAIVATSASANVRRVGRGIVRSKIPVVNDEVCFKFGTEEPTPFGATDTSVILSRAVCVPAVAVAPGHSLVLYMYGASNAGAPAWEFAAGWSER